MNNERGLEPCRIYVDAWAEPHLKALRWYIDSIEVSPTDKGQKLTTDPATGRGAWGGGTINDSQASSIVLDGSFEGARHLGSLRVTAHFALELERQVLEIPDVLNVHHGVYDLGGYRLNLKGVNKMSEDGYSYEYSIFRDGHSPADWQVMQTMVTVKLVDAQGKRLNGTSGGGRYGPNEIESSQNMTTDGAGGIKTGEPSRLIFDVPSKFEHRLAVFELKDVSLPQ